MAGGNDLWAAITLAEKEGRLNKPHFQPAKPHRIYIAPDFHVPYHHKDAVIHCLDLALGADVIIQIGDALDCYGISSFDRNPNRAICLQREIDAYRDCWLRPVRKNNPNARIIQLLGNHEDRLKKTLWKQAPALANMRGLAWEKSMGLKRLNIELHPGTGLLVAGHRVKHGERVNKHAGYSARMEMEDHRSDGISGHTHRYGVARRTDKEGHTTTWYEIGHACDQSQVAAEYCKNPDWNLSAGITLTTYPDASIEYVEHRLN